MSFLKLNFGLFLYLKKIKFIKYLIKFNAAAKQLLIPE